MMRAVQLHCPTTSMTCTLSSITLSSYKHDAFTVLFGLKSGLLIANQIREFCYSFDSHGEQTLFGMGRAMFEKWYRDIAIFLATMEFSRAFHQINMCCIIWVCHCSSKYSKYYSKFYLPMRGSWNGSFGRCNSFMKVFLRAACNIFIKTTLKAVILLLSVHVISVANHIIRIPERYVSFLPQR